MYYHLLDFYLIILNKMVKYLNYQNILLNLLKLLMLISKFNFIISKYINFIRPEYHLFINKVLKMPFKIK